MEIPRKLERLLFFTTILFIPTQLGKHFWPTFSFVEGIRIDYLSPTLYITDILILMLLATSVLTRILLQRDKISNKLTNYRLSITLFLVLLVVGILQSYSPIAGWYKLLKLFEFGFFGFYTASVVNKKEMITVCMLLAAGIIVESILAIAQFWRQASIGSIFWYLGERTFSGQTVGIANASIDSRLVLRPYGTFPHPNVLAGYLVVTMTLVVACIKYYVLSIKKNFLFCAILIGSFALFLILSRVAIILWFLMLCWFLIARFRQKLFALRFLLCSLLLLVVLGSIFLLTPLPSRFTSIMDVGKESFLRRQELNASAIAMVKKSPIVGIGLNNFLVRLPEFSRKTAGPLWLQPVHNIFLLLAAETGLVGLVFIIHFLIQTVQYLIKKKEFQISNFKFQILFLVLVLGVFDHYFLTLQQGQLLCAFVFGLVWSKAHL